MSKFYYKIVKKNRKTYSSLFAQGKSRVIYSKDKEVFPPKWLQRLDYGLLVFTSLKAVKDGYHLSSNSEVWKVTGEKIPLKPFSNDIYLGNSFFTPASRITFPKGSAMLKSVTFIEEVKV